MEKIFSVLKGIVYLFSSVFSFMPSWVSVFIGGVVLLVIGIIIYKLIRG